ncbi:Probable tRNA N6-adenosine threonylcarbamoyltransferase, mitochondrial [Eumeta japonica]|uniref:N(6)-L-threonylcarbamoyladenine synthase n=1 Tax=Eumeta variegata TaxID=151549 RepID=A0A4C1XID5_EUMVA|nr:Probable tRNA N6-adenosine threonylcarbamoyltransferase, mitochondrial [Eumeta japonica]
MYMVGLEGHYTLRAFTAGKIINSDLSCQPLIRLEQESIGKTTGIDQQKGCVTVKPGLRISLEVGVKYAKHLARLYSKPFIPIHHMEAHALVARVYHDVGFPFLTLLISGGHCQLVIVKDIDDFMLIGETIDDAPGEAYDKTARRMKLRNISEYAQLSGGKAIETAAAKAKIHIVSVSSPLRKVQRRSQPPALPQGGSIRGRQNHNHCIMTLESEGTTTKFLTLLNYRSGAA